MQKKIEQKDITNHLKNTGFVYQSSEIYNGLSNSWDYGPLGVLLKNNLKKLWWKHFVTKQHNVVGLDSSIIINPNVWKASGHLDNFSDPLIDCKECKSRFRADKLVEEFTKISVNESTTNEEFQKILESEKISCPKCKKRNWTDIRSFNLMFKTFQGVVENSTSELYLRPETAQGIFINFKNVQRTSRQKIPFGIAQIGKSFRNEITPGNFIFRTREFEQMEIEFFIHPSDYEKEFNKYENKIKDFLINECWLKESNLNIYNHSKEELSHYSEKTIDFEYNFVHGKSELWGLAYRTNFDLTTHAEHSKKDLSYLDPITNEKYIPHVIEPSVGLERLMYAILTEAYEEQTLEDESERTVLKLPYSLTPFKACVIPLTNKLKDEAFDLYTELLELDIDINFESGSSIGKNYRRQDAIGTYYCITFDFESKENNTFTVRNRDTMKQVRVSKEELKEMLLNKTK